MFIVQDMQGISWRVVIILYIKVFFVPYGYRSTGLSYIELKACVFITVKNAAKHWQRITCTIEQLPYILQSNPHTNLIRTSFCRFLKQKKKVSSRF
jgi:hypothetical protein